MLSPRYLPQPYPSYPALCRQDTTSAWSTDYGGNHQRLTVSLWASSLLSLSRAGLAQVVLRGSSRSSSCSSSGSTCTSDRNGSGSGGKVVIVVLVELVSSNRNTDSGGGGGDGGE